MPKKKGLEVRNICKEIDRLADNSLDLIEVREEGNIESAIEYYTKLADLFAKLKKTQEQAEGHPELCGYGDYACKSTHDEWQEDLEALSSPYEAAQFFIENTEVNIGDLIEVRFSQLPKMKPILVEKVEEDEDDEEEG